MNALLWMALAAAAALDSRVDAVFQEYDRLDSPGCAVGVYRDETLEPVSRDEFRSSLGTIQFQRGTSGNVTGFTISTDRTRNLRWEKR